MWVLECILLWKNVLGYNWLVDFIIVIEIGEGNVLANAHIERINLAYRLSLPVFVARSRRRTRGGLLSFFSEPSESFAHVLRLQNLLFRRCLFHRRIIVKRQAWEFCLHLFATWRNGSSGNIGTLVDACPSVHLNLCTIFIHWVRKGERCSFKEHVQFEGSVVVIGVPAQSFLQHRISTSTGNLYDGYNVVKPGRFGGGWRVGNRHCQHDDDEYVLCNEIRIGRKRKSEQNMPLCLSLLFFSSCF